MFFYLTSEKVRLSAERRLAVIQEIAQAAGICGMVGGQALDVLSGKSASDEDTLYEIHRRKTGALIVAAVKSGAIIFNARKDKIQALAEYGINLGLAFQIADDILNVEGDRELMGKETGSDAARDKLTYPSLLGMEVAKEKLAKYIEAAVASLAGFDERAHAAYWLIARYIIGKKIIAYRNIFDIRKVLVLVKQLETVNYSVLKNVEFPADIRKLNIAELNTLAQEIRELDY